MYNYEQKRLNIQLVPKTAWCKNSREIPNWSEISTKIRSIKKCQICECNKELDELDAHEIWDFNEDTQEQTLKDIISVCKDCHNTIHFGLARKKHTDKEAIEQYIKVNNCSKAEFKKDSNEAFLVWLTRSSINWKLDENKLKRKIFELTGIKCIDITEPIDGKYYAKVKYEEKELAKSMGAKWDPIKKLWYFLSENDRSNWNNR